MNLQEYRKLKKITVTQTSEDLRISRQHIYDIEKRKSFPSRKLAMKICKWSDGLVTEGELLFPDLMMPVSNNLAKVESWEEDGRRDKTHNLRDNHIMENKTYAGIC